MRTPTAPIAPCDADGPAPDGPPPAPQRALVEVYTGVAMAPADLAGVRAMARAAPLAALSAPSGGEDPAAALRARVHALALAAGLLEPPVGTYGATSAGEFWHYREEAAAVVCRVRFFAGPLGGTEADVALLCGPGGTFDVGLPPRGAKPGRLLRYRLRDGAAARHAAMTGTAHPGRVCAADFVCEQFVRPGIVTPGGVSA